jgi:hypothetical protein
MRRFALLANEQGNILIVTLLILFGVSLIGSTLATMSSMDLKISANRQTYAQAFYVAEAGLNEAIHRLAVPNPTNVRVGDWTGNIAIGDQEPYDPDWEVRIYLTDPGSTPLGDVGVISTGTVQDPEAPYLRYSAPTGTDNVLTIRHKWVDRDDDGIREPDEIARWDPARIPSENFKSGNAIDVITVTGYKGKSRRTIRAEVTPRVDGGDNSSHTPKTKAAIFAKGALNIQHSEGICGYNHSIDMPFGTTTRTCVDFHTGSGDVAGVAGTGNGRMQVGARTAMAGFPAPADNTPKPWIEPWEVLGITESDLEDMLSDADHTSVESTMNGISYFSGDCVIDRPVTGSGLLFAEKKIDIRDDFEWRGLIYAGGELTIMNDNCMIIGALVGRDAINWSPGSGAHSMLYSEEAIRRIVKTKLKGRKRASGGPITVLSWREL